MISKHRMFVGEERQQRQGMFVGEEHQQEHQQRQGIH